MPEKGNYGPQGATHTRNRPAAASMGAKAWRTAARWLPRILVALLALVYAWLRYAASGMEQSQFPGDTVQRVDYGANTLVTFQSGDPSGQPVIFVHGTPGAADNWRRFLVHPHPGFWCIAVDRPGFGRSTPRGGLARLPEQAAALQPLLESLRGRRPILVGHSLGGPIIVQAALDYPDLVGGLAIIAGSLDPSVEKVFAIQYFGDFPGIREIVPRFLRNSNHELLPLREDLETLFPRLKNFTCPAVLVHGTADSLVPFENVAYMQAAFPPAVINDTIILDGEDHFLPWTAPDAIWRAIEALTAKA